MAKGCQGREWGYQGRISSEYSIQIESSKQVRFDSAKAGKGRTREVIQGEEMHVVDRKVQRRTRGNTGGGNVC